MQNTSRYQTQVRFLNIDIYHCHIVSPIAFKLQQHYTLHGIKLSSAPLPSKSVTLVREQITDASSSLHHIHKCAATSHISATFQIMQCRILCSKHHSLQKFSLKINPTEFHNSSSMCESRLILSPQVRLRHNFCLLWFNICFKKILVSSQILNYLFLLNSTMEVTYKTLQAL